MAQLAFSLPHAPAYDAADFFVSEANHEAHRWVTAWPDWPANALVLTGSAESGKTHLARMWQARSGGEIIENFEGEDAEDLLHRLNAAREEGRFLLLTSRLTPAAWPFTLPDLTSRLGALPKAQLSPPDDALLAALLAKLFADRQLRASGELVAWLASRIERSFSGAARAVKMLDEAALAEGRNLTLALAQKVMAL